MIKCGHCGGRHATVLDVRNCSSTVVADQKRRAEEANAYFDAVVSNPRKHVNSRCFVTPAGESAGGRVATLPKAPTQVTEDGMYRKADGRIFKVQHAVHGSGRLYAKQLILTMEDQACRKTVLEEIPLEGSTFLQVHSAKFVYAPGAINHLSAEERMTIEQAKEFGALYGTCCRCGLTLTDEKSIERGMGPICAKKI